MFCRIGSRDVSIYVPYMIKMTQNTESARHSAYFLILIDDKRLQIARFSFIITGRNFCNMQLLFFACIGLRSPDSAFLASADTLCQIRNA